MGTMNDLPTLIDTAAVVPAPDENGGKQDSPTNFLKYDDTDVTAVTLKGNTWKAFPLPTPYQITEATEIHFDFDLISTGEIHGFCMYTSTMQMVGGRDNEACFQMAGTQNAGWQTTDHNQAEGAYTWRVGDEVQGEVAFIGYILDYDAGDKYSKGEHTISNFRMAERLPVSISIDGSPVVIPNNQLSYGSNQDFRDNLVEVSEGGSKISMYGNLWKALPFSSPVTVTENTVLSFTVSVDEVTDFVALCLEEDRTQGDEYRCFKLSGKQQSNLGPLIYRGINQVDEGNSYHYIIKLNSYFTGTMNYLTFLQDNDGAYNDGDRYAGVSHISNIRLYEQPAESCFANQDFTFSLTVPSIALLERSASFQDVVILGKNLSLILTPTPTRKCPISFKTSAPQRIQKISFRSPRSWHKKISSLKNSLMGEPLGTTKKANPPESHEHRLCRIDLSAS